MPDTGTEQTRRGRQLNLIIDSFRATMRVDAHQMLLKHGITRTAHYIFELRRHGWDIKTERREPGEMAVYRLVKYPPSWALPAARRVRATSLWACVACGAWVDTSDVDVKTPTRASGMCPNEKAKRMFRPA